MNPLTVNNFEFITQAYTISLCLRFLGQTSNCNTTAVGEGGALVLVGCQRDFDGEGPCHVNGSIFTVNHAAKSSGTVQVGNSNGPSYVELYGCAILNGTAGNSSVEGDQGEGGAFGVGTGSTLVLVDTTVRGCSAAKKVCKTRDRTDWG